MARGAVSAARTMISEIPLFRVFLYANEYGLLIDVVEAGEPRCSRDMLGEPGSYSVSMKS
jgi:hypothetical protein